MKKKGKWGYAFYGRKTLGVGRLGGPALIFVRPRDGNVAEMVKDVEELLVAANEYESQDNSREAKP